MTDLEKSYSASAASLVEAVEGISERLQGLFDTAIELGARLPDDGDHEYALLQQGANRVIEAKLALRDARDAFAAFSMLEDR